MGYMDLDLGFWQGKSISTPRESNDASGEMGKV